MRAGSIRSFALPADLQIVDDGQATPLTDTCPRWLFTMRILRLQLQFHVSLSNSSARDFLHGRTQPKAAAILTSWDRPQHSSSKGSAISKFARPKEARQKKWPFTGFIEKRSS